MTLRVPVEKVADSGLRKISSKDKMQAVTATLKGRARSKRTMWSRRAQEYEAKINSGDPVAIAEVVRDLYRAAGQPEQSYSERQMYEAALERLVNEYALVEKLDVEAATEKIESVRRVAASRRFLLEACDVCRCVFLIGKTDGPIWRIDRTPPSAA